MPKNPNTAHKRKILQNGRNGQERFVRLPHAMLRSDAYECLSNATKVILVELMARYNGGNNGLISLSYREARRVAKCGDDTTKKAFDELIERGFVKCVEKGRFARFEGNRHASTWLLTFHHSDVTRASATNEWRDWPNIQKTESSP